MVPCAGGVRKGWSSSAVIYFVLEGKARLMSLGMKAYQFLRANKKEWLQNVRMACSK